MDEQSLERLEDEIAALETSFGQATAMAASFDAELRRIHQTFSATGQQAEALESAFGRGLRRAIDGVVLDGLRLSDALAAVGRSLIATAYSAAVRPVTDHLGGLFAQGIAGLFGGLSAFGLGAGFAQGRVMPFASGGVISGPTTFAMRGGLGLMGEAGPEAILPLQRGADGRLGVRAEGQGARPVQVVMNISTPDARSFERSGTQIAARMVRALARAQKAN